MSNSQGKKSCSVWLFLIILAIIGGFAVLTIAGTNYLLNATARDFGNPRPGLGLRTHIQYAVMLNISRNNLIMPGSSFSGIKPFTVEQGENVASILNRLEQEGVIPDARAMRTYLQYSGLDTSIQSGEFEFPAGLSAIDVAQMLQEPVFGDITFTVLPGWRMEEIAGALAVSGFTFTSSEFLTSAKAEPSLISAAFPGQYGTYEGFLFPATYTFERDATAVSIANQMVSRFLENLPGEFSTRCQQNGLSFHQCVTLASIVEKESMITAEQPLIASVFYNRLAVGMKLESDPTVQYALGSLSENSGYWKNPLTTSDLSVNSEYNTYLYPGIPPSPISNPGISALQAVIYPETSGYYYFRAKCDNSGAHNFAVSFQEHLMNACP